MRLVLIVLWEIYTLLFSDEGMATALLRHLRNLTQTSSKTKFAPADMPERVPRVNGSRANSYYSKWIESIWHNPNRWFHLDPYIQRTRGLYDLHPFTLDPLHALPC